MKRLYIQRHAKPVDGDTADMARDLSEQGKLDAMDMAMLMQSWIGRVDMVICAPSNAATQTADIMAPALGCDLIATTTLLQGNGNNESIRAEVERLSQATEDVLVVCDSAVADELADLYLGLSEVAANDDEDRTLWIARRFMAAQEHYAREIDEAARTVAQSIGLMEKRGDKAKGTYTYEEIILKRWQLGDGGRSGNCELCVENADRGWIDSEDVFEGVFGDVDEPEAHPNCTCEVEFKTSRRRVYD